MRNMELPVPKALTQFDSTRNSHLYRHSSPMQKKRQPQRSNRLKSTAFHSSQEA